MAGGGAGDGRRPRVGRHGFGMAQCRQRELDRCDEVVDESGQLRLILQTPDWDDFVQLAIREIRSYGAGNFQVARRLRFMIESLVRILPEQRHPALVTELILLDAALRDLYQLPGDLALASVPDPQGMGAAS